MPRKNTLAADYPQAVLQQIEQLAHNIVIARKRRGESQAQWAKRLGISQPTMVRIERGDPSVAMASYVMCMWLINQAEGLADLVAPQYDHTALEKEVAKVRLKRRPGKQAGSSAPQPKALADHSESATKEKRAQLVSLPASEISSEQRSKLFDLIPRAASPLDEMHKSLSLAHATKPSDLAALSKASGIAALQATKLSDLVPRATSPLDEMHKSLSLAHATKLSDLAALGTASGIAALLAKPERKKK